MPHRAWQQAARLKASDVVSLRDTCTLRDRSPFRSGFVRQTGLLDHGLIVHEPFARGAPTTLESRISVDRLYLGLPLLHGTRTIQGVARATTASDIYSFGCILHDLIDGGTRVPYATQTVKGPFDPIVRRCTRQEPDQRFRGISALRSSMADVLARTAHLDVVQTQPDAWVSRKNDLNTWSEETSEEFTTYLEAVPPGEELGVTRQITDADLEMLAQRTPRAWNRIGLAYCAWACGSFTFSLCDDIVGHLRWIASHADSSLELKAAAITSAAKLGADHNRWFVMQKVVQLAGASLDDTLAQRIAIEIRAQCIESEFRRCAERISLEIGVYHPLIAAVVRGDTLGLSRTHSSETWRRAIRSGGQSGPAASC